MTDGNGGTALVAIHPEAVQLGTLRANQGGELIHAASEIATPLGKLIAERKLYNDISGKRHVRCEGWTTLAIMLGVLPREVAVVKHADGTYEATVALVRTVDGTELTRASAECGADEPTWSDRPNYARRSMAITRATSKVCRMAFSWVMVLAGYEATPAEELPGEDPIRLPGAADRWGGHGGKPIRQVPTEVLAQARTWLAVRDAKKNATLIAAIDEETESRRGEPAGAA